MRRRALIRSVLAVRNHRNYRLRGDSRGRYRENVFGTVGREPVKRDPGIYPIGWPSRRSVSVIVEWPCERTRRESFRRRRDYGPGRRAFGCLWGYKRSDNVDAVVYVDINGHLHELAKAAGSWTDTDFTASPLVNAPLAPATALGATNCEAIAYVRTDNKNAVIYRGASNHLYEVASNFSSSPPWIVSDLTAFTGAPNAKNFSATPYIRSDSRNTIVYMATDNHIHKRGQKSFFNKPAIYSQPAARRSCPRLAPGATNVPTTSTLSCSSETTHPIPSCTSSHSTSGHCAGPGIRGVQA